MKKEKFTIWKFVFEVENLLFERQPSLYPNIEAIQIQILASYDREFA